VSRTNSTGRRWAGLRDRLVRPRSQEPEELADLELALSGVSHGRVWIDHIPVTPSDPLSSHVASIDQILDDSLRRALCHSHQVCNVAQPRVGVVLDAQEDLRVVREKMPAIGFRT
jgi:hypothetical protein